MHDKKNAQFMKKIGNVESTTVEWKKSLAVFDEIMETISAFSNAEGGKIYIGVSDGGEVLGIQIGKGTIEDLVNRIGQHTDPKVFPKISVLKIDGKEVIVIDVKESRDHLVLADGKPYKRVGRTSPKMSKDEYERLIVEKHKTVLAFDAEVAKGATLADIDTVKVRKFVALAQEERGLDIEVKSSVKDVLKRLHLLKGNKLTHAAILLFGKKTREFFSQSESKCVRFKGLDVTGEMIDLKPINGDIIKQLKDIEKFIYDHIYMRAWIESGKLQRQEKWEYPPKAIREALANAMAHRDYRTTSKVQVRIFDDRIEFWNPAILPRGWTAETLKKKHESKPFNPLLAESFFWIKYAEEVGTGTNKIITWCREWGLPDPNFEYAGSSLVVTIRKTMVTDEYLAQFALGERERKIMDHLSVRSRIDSGDVQKMFGITRETSNQLLKKLIGLKLIQRQGIGKATFYVLKGQ